MLVAANANRGHGARVECAGDNQSDQANHRAGARAWRGRAGRRRPGRAAPRRRCAGARLRFLRLLEPQDVRSDGRRRALRTIVAARGHAAVPGWGRHNRIGHIREDLLQRRSLQVRGGHTQYCGGRSRSSRTTRATRRSPTRSSCGWIPSTPRTRSSWCGPGCAAATPSPRPAPSRRTSPSPIGRRRTSSPYARSHSR